MHLNAIIIEDEIKGRDTLRNMLARFCPEVNVIGEALTVKQGVELIEKKTPDIIFLDIELPEKNGFTLLDYYPSPDFDIIFTTAYDQFAVQAFRISAIDYLLKPINFKELIQAVNKVKSKKNIFQKRDRFQSLSHNIKTETFDKIALPVANGYLFVEIPDIVFCEADRNYTVFNLKNGKKQVVSKPLKYFEDLLCNLYFFRINRSVIINLYFLKSYSRSRTGEVILKNDKIFTLSEQKKKRFLERINL